MKVIKKKGGGIVLHFSADEVNALKKKLGLVTYGDLVGTLVDLKSAGPEVALVEAITE